MKRRNTITAALFLAALCAGFGLMVTAFFGGSGVLRAELGLARRDLSRLPALLDGGAEAAANQDLDRDHGFIQIYGLFQRLSGRRVIEDMNQTATVVRLENGALNFAYLTEQESDIGGNTQNTVRLAQALRAEGRPYLFLLAPQKVERGASPLPVGLRDHGNSQAGAFLGGLGESGVDSLDLRPLFEETEDYAAWFFRTDHHWRPEAAFRAWGALTQVLEEDYGLAAGGDFTDGERWDKTVLEEFFLGSQGKRVGSLYGGTDDFTVYTPRFDTDLTYTCPFYAIDRSGPFAQSVCFPERIAERDWFNANPYTYYAGGDYPVATIVNHKNPDGPRILLIRDSFACAITPFLALSCSELTTVDLRYLKDNLLETIRAADPDLVLTLYTVGTVGKADMFDFFREASGG